RASLVRTDRHTAGQHFHVERCDLARFVETDAASRTLIIWASTHREEALQQALGDDLRANFQRDVDDGQTRQHSLFREMDQPPRLAPLGWRDEQVQLAPRWSKLQLVKLLDACREERLRDILRTKAVQRVLFQREAGVE